MATYRIDVEGPAALALRAATALADADGVELTSSDPPAELGDGRVALHVTVDGDADAVVDAVAAIRRDLPDGATVGIATP